MERTSESHIPTVAAAHDRDPIGIQIRLAFDPVEQSADILHRILPLHGVIEIEKRFSVSIRSTDVGTNQGDPKFIEQIIMSTQKDRAELGFGSSMNQDDHRRFFDFTRRLLIKESGNGAPVE